MHIADANERLMQVVEANIRATHAYQVARALKTGRGDRTCFSSAGLDDAELEQLVAHQRALLAEDPQTIRAWVQGESCAFEPARYLQPLLTSAIAVTAPALPVNVLTTFLQTRASCPPSHARAVASLLQMQLDVDRDADRLQELFELYTILGLPVHTERLGWSAQTDDAFLEAATELVPQFCACPFNTDAATLRMMFRKMWNWGHRYTGERDKRTLAGELLREAQVATLVPEIQRMPAQKIAVIGHSYTMNVHWSSPSAFVPIASEVLGRVNPQVQVRQWQAGGMNPARADFRRFCDEALGWKPDRVLLVIAFYGKEDPAALEKAVADFAGSGARVEMFDTLYGKAPLSERFYVERTVLDGIARKTGMTIIEVESVLNASPDLARFVSLDGVHMTEPYHRLMAREWLAHLCRTRADAGC